MQRESFKQALGRPALHVGLTVCFGAAFFWPIFAMTQPSQTFHFLYGAWFLCLGALVAVSQAATDGGEAHDEAELDAADANEGVN